MELVDVAEAVTASSLTFVADTEPVEVAEAPTLCKVMAMLRFPVEVGVAVALSTLTFVAAVLAVEVAVAVTVRLCEVAPEEALAMNPEENVTSVGIVLPFG
jgi:Mg2+/Co2+ transporter CorB